MPPAILNAGGVMLKILKIRVPAIEKTVSTKTQVHAAWRAMRRRLAAESSEVMTKNEGNLDRIFRGGLAVTALGVGLAVGGVFNPLGILLFGVAGMAGWTAISGYCPLYSLLGISTCPLPQQG